MAPGMDELRPPTWISVDTAQPPTNDKEYPSPYGVSRRDQS
jgi:hypothetical protein